MLLTSYLIATTVVFAFLAILWGNSNWPNLFIKMVFFSGFVGGLLLSLSQFGILIKV